MSQLPRSIVNGFQKRAREIVLGIGLFPQLARAKADPLLGAVFLSVELLKFFAVCTLVSGVVALCTPRMKRWRAFWRTFMVWPLLCVAIQWGPPTVDVVRSWASGETWGSFSGEFPGYLDQLTRYIALNHLVPNLRFEQLAIAIAVLIALTLSLRFRTVKACAASALLVASTGLLLPNVREPFRADRCLDLGSSYNYEVGACGDGSFPYLPQHVRHPALTAVGVMSGITGIVLFVLGVSDRGLQVTRESMEREV